MKALVVYGSKRGGTEGLAWMVGDALAEQGIAVTVTAAGDRSADVGFYDVVVVGGGLYANRWNRSARRFVRRHSRVLREQRVWLFSSGPLGETAHDAASIGPVPQVRKIMEKVGAKGHITFGGVLAADAKGFPASAMAKTMAGDWRDPERVTQWAKEIAADLGE